MSDKNKYEYDCATPINNVEGAASSRPPSAGLEMIEDDNNGPMQPSDIEALVDETKIQKPEYISDDDVPIFSYEEEDVADVIAKKQQVRGPEEIHDDEGPINNLQIEKSSKINSVDHAKVSRKISQTISDVAENQNSPPDVTNTSECDDEDDKDSQVGNEVSTYPNGVNPVVETVVGQHQEQNNEYAAIIPEAFLVSDEEREDQQPVIISGYAEALVPWWKQTRTKLLVGTFIVCIAVLSITLGVTLSSDDTTEVVKIQTQTVLASSPPSSSFTPSAVPSYVPTAIPSMSHVPSPLPTHSFE